jgi:hypothetical protein
MEPDYPIGKGAVLYKTTPDTDDRTELWHVLGVYDEREGNQTYVRLADGTHTEYAWRHIDDVLAMYEPAGWSCRDKPTYILTRKYDREVYPKDFMREELYQ